MQLPRVMDVSHAAGSPCVDTVKKAAAKARQPRPWLGALHGGGNHQRCCHVHVEHGKQGRSWIAAAAGHMAVRHPLLPSQIDPELDPEGDFAVPVEALKIASEKAGGWFRIRDLDAVGDGRVEVSLPGGPRRWELGNASILPKLDSVWMARGSDSIPGDGCPFEVSINLQLLIDAAAGLGAKHSDGEIPITLQFNSELDSIQVMLTPGDRDERPGVPEFQHPDAPKNGVASARMVCTGDRGATGYLDRERHAAALVMPRRNA